MLSILDCATVLLNFTLTKYLNRLNSLESSLYLEIYVCVFVFHKAISKKLVFLNKHVLFCSFMGQAETGEFYQTFKKSIVQNRTPLNVWITTDWKILQEMGIPDHLTCLLRNLYAGQEATVRTGHEMTDWLQIRKGVRQGCILSPCLFNLYAEYLMRNAGLDEAQAGIKITERNINNLRYADDTTLKAESEVEIKSLLMKVKEESEKVRKLRSWHPVSSVHGK